MRNYKNRLDALKKAINSKVAKVVFLDFRNGQYFHKGKKVVDITKLNADVLIVDDIPDEEKEGEEDESNG